MKDYFYQYGGLAGDDKEDPGTKQRGHFGCKVLALSYGGTLQLRGQNGTAGTTQNDIDKVLLPTPDKVAESDRAKITNSGTDWVRQTKVGGTKLSLDRKVDWPKGSEVVVTTTDYVPEHSEVRTHLTRMPMAPTSSRCTRSSSTSTRRPHTILVSGSGPTPPPSARLSPRRTTLRHPTPHRS